MLLDFVRPHFVEQIELGEVWVSVVVVVVVAVTSTCIVVVVALELVLALVPSPSSAELLFVVGAHAPVLDALAVLVPVVLALSGVELDDLVVEEQRNELKQ